MSVFLDNQINICRAGMYILDNLEAIYERCANNIINDPTRFGIHLNLVEVQAKNKFTKEKEEMLFFQVRTTRNIGLPPIGIMNYLSALPLKYKNNDFAELFNIFYFEVMYLELTFTELVGAHRQQFEKIPVYARNLVITRILTQLVLDSCDNLEFEGIRRLRLYPMFCKSNPMVIRMATLENTGEFHVAPSLMIDIPTKLRSLTTAFTQNTQEFVLQ